MEQLRREIKNKELNGLYLFYGEEKYLIRTWEKSFIKACLPDGFIEMNLSVMEGKGVTLEKIAEAAQTPPFMSDKKLIIIRDSELFTAKRKADGDTAAELFREQFEGGVNGIVMLFAEEEVDKRGKAYKALSKFGKATEFKQLTENQLSIWVKEILRKRGLTISNPDTVYLIRVASGDMERIEKEIEKLSSYKREGKIDKADIDSICAKTPESRIFDLIDAVAAKNKAQSLAIYSELLAMKEQPVGILAMLGRQFRLMLKCRLLSESGLSLNGINERLGANPYAVKISLAQSKAFAAETLKQAVLDSTLCDTNIKTGVSEAKLGVELLIIKYSSR